MPKIYFIDVTNRDGAQTARISLAKLQKTMLNIYLGEMGVHQSEFGFPFSRHEQSYIKANLELKEKGVMGSIVLQGWCRAVISDVAESLPTGVKDLNLSISTSDQMIINKFKGKLDRKTVVRQMTEAVKFARDGGIKTIGVNAEDASRTELNYLLEFAHVAKEAGADRVRYCDTLGYDTPWGIYDRINTLAREVKLPLELHCHNDLGMAVANSVAGAKGAVDGGVDAYINVTVNGIGERAGQADLLSCALAFKFGRGMHDYEIGDRLNLKVANKIANYASSAFAIPIPITQPGVGANAFAHESGIHADGALKDHHNYELFDFELIGRDQEMRIPGGRVITTGEYGGVAGVKHVYDKLGVNFPSESACQRILELVQYANMHTQIPLTDDELRLIADHPDQVRKILTVTP